MRGGTRGVGDGIAARRKEPRRSMTSGVHPGRTGEAFTPRSGAHDLAGADARGARVDPATVAGGDERPHGLDVRVPTARRPAVRVRHRHTETGPLATDVAHGSHGGSLPEEKSYVKGRGTRGARIKTVQESNR